MSILKENRGKPALLRDKAFWRVTLSLAIPIALQNMLSASFSLVDTLMVSQLGDIELSSTGMAGQWTWLFNMMLFGICSGAAVFVSQYWGEKNIKGIHRSTGIALFSGLLISLLFLMAGLIIPDKIIYVFNKNPRVIEQGATYLRFACISYPALAISNILGSTLRASEHPKLPMIVSGACAAINALLNYILIFPAGLGVKGAAIATAISAWISPILLIAISFASKNILRTPLRDYLAFSFASIVEFFKKALPVVLNESMWGLGTVTYNVIFANIGYEEYAAITIARTFENFAFCFFLGLCNACCVMVGKSIGAGEILEAKRDSKRFMLLFPMVSAAVGSMIIILRHPLVSIFNLGSGISQYTIQTAEWIFVIFGAWIIVRNVAYLTVVGIFRPGGDTSFGMLIELLVLWCFSVPMTFIAANVLHLPFLAVYIIMYLCEDIPKSLIFIPYWASGKWIKPVTEAGRAGLKKLKSGE